MLPFPWQSSQAMNATCSGAIAPRRQRGEPRQAPPPTIRHCRWHPLTMDHPVRVSPAASRGDDCRRTSVALIVARQGLSMGADEGLGGERSSSR